MTVAMVVFFLLLGAYMHKIVKPIARCILGVASVCVICVILGLAWAGKEAMAMFEAFVLFSWHLGRKSA